MSRKLVLVAAFALMLAVPSTASAGHGLKAWLNAYYDHPAPAFAPTVPPSPVFSSGGPGAHWELVASIPTGNPHTDIDFFTQGGETYASVGTLAIGPNGGGQTIVQLTQNGAGHAVVAASSSPGTRRRRCLSNPAAALGLQHDVEATPKGNAHPATRRTLRRSSTRRPAPRRRDRRSAAAATTRACSALETRRSGGLEIIDVTDVDEARSRSGSPATSASRTRSTSTRSGRTSPTRSPPTASASTPTASARTRIPTAASASTSTASRSSTCPRACTSRRADASSRSALACRPEVYRYRYPSARWRSATRSTDSIYGCHELEVYPDDRLTCGERRRADRVRHERRLRRHAARRPTSPTTSRAARRCRAGARQLVESRRSRPARWSPTASTAPVTGTDDLDVPDWLASGAPSLEGVRYLGSVHHQGRGADGPTTQRSTRPRTSTSTTRPS